MEPTNSLRDAEVTLRAANRELGTLAAQVRLIRTRVIAALLLLDQQLTGGTGRSHRRRTPMVPVAGTDQPQLPPPRSSPVPTSGLQRPPKGGKGSSKLPATKPFKPGIPGLARNIFASEVRYKGFAASLPEAMHRWLGDGWEDKPFGHLAGPRTHVSTTYGQDVTSPKSYIRRQLEHGAMNLLVERWGKEPDIKDIQLRANVVALGEQEFYNAMVRWGILPERKAG